MNTPPFLFSFEEEVGLEESCRRADKLFRRSESYKFERAFLYSVTLNLAALLTIFSAFISHTAVLRLDLFELAATTIFFWMFIFVGNVPFSATLIRRKFFRVYLKKMNKNSIRQKIEIGTKALYLKIDDYEKVVPYECVRSVIETRSNIMILDYFFTSFISGKPPPEFLLELKKVVTNYQVKNW
jgi:hypothetical protein